MRLKRYQPTIRHLDEPLIDVADGISVPEPKMGWSLLGPHGKRSDNYTIRVALVGDSESIEKCNDLFQRLKVTTYGKDKNLLHVNFPGLNKLRITLRIISNAEIEEQELSRLDKAVSFTDRVQAATTIIQEKIDAIVDRDPAPDIIVVAYPKKIDYYCIEGAIGQKRAPIKSLTEKRIEKIRSKHHALDEFFVTSSSNAGSFKPRDLRSMLKSIGMKYDMPIQIIRPNTTDQFDPANPRHEDDATLYWNLLVAMFYKSNHIQWQVKGLMTDTCYIGVAFFRDADDVSNLRTALAQVFTLDSEGFVIKGRKALIDENNSPHVSKADSIRLLQRAIDVFSRNKNGQNPRRIVVHKTSRFNNEEIEGFNAGSLGIQKLDLVAFGSREIKLMRWGHHPPIRGTMVKLPDDSVLLYTYGYIPYLDTYPGPRVPSPLEILEHHGTTAMETICREIMALSKLNWNNAKFCSKAPITIGFAKRIGSILREIPPATESSDVGKKLKFYM